MLVRRLARPMLAAQFITDNVKATLKPEPNGQGIERLIGAAFTRVTGQEPSETTSRNIARGTAVLGILGGGMLALGVLPRVGAVVVSAVSISRFITSNSLAGKSMSERRDVLLQSTGELTAIGGALLAVVDTAGKPSLVNRARQVSKEARLHATIVKQDANLSSQSAKLEAKSLAKQARNEARALGRTFKADAKKAVDSAQNSVKQMTASTA